MLYGEYVHNMDPKGRVTVPSKFREELGDAFFIGRGVDGCLYMQSKEELDKMQEKISGRPAKIAAQLSKFFVSGSICVETDKQGRILIPQNLRQHAGLLKEVVIAGTGPRAEIWDAEKWNDYISAITPEVLDEAIGDMIL